MLTATESYVFLAVLVILNAAIYGMVLRDIIDIIKGR